MRGLLVLLSLLSVAPVLAQEINVAAKFSPSTYMYHDYISDFDLVFSDVSAKHNFSLIQKYTQDKGEIQFMIQELILEYGTKAKCVDMTLAEYLNNLDHTLRGDGEKTKQQFIENFYKMQRVDSLNKVIYER
ncbi:MAG: hypothetical protein LBH34_04585, partial [Prevotellaceae bacterium]|nr:hypothetical protein [Prevotellaceae bacterium]